MGGVTAIDLENVSSNWPLIRYLMDDPVYQEVYDGYVSETIDTVFDPDRMTAIYQELHDLITPYVAAEQPGYTTLSAWENFDAALTQLVNHVNERNTVAQEYLSNPNQ